MNQEQRSLLLNSLPSHPAASCQGGKVIYGARGFSGDASLLQPTAYKAGILAALRSLKSQSVIGLMITASGDVEGSAGVRIIDPDGRMLTSQWKPFADSVVNVGDPDDFVALIEKIVTEENISLQSGQPAEIWLGRSTTPNGESLSHSAKQGISSIVGAVVHDKGVLTAPQLHWLVRAKNEGLKSSEHDYFDQLSASYRCLAVMIPRKTTSESTSQKLVVYGADGVGGKLKVLKQLCNGLEMDIQNSGEGDCTASGINFVEKVKIFASGFGPGNVEHRFASFDADAERLVYLFPRPSQNEIDVVHRDKFLSLFAFFIREQLNILDDDENPQPNSHCYSHLGIVQNTSVGEASAAFLKSLGFTLVLLPDGVECLHEETAKYDIGICATEDRRWTILFSERILSWLESENKDLSSTPGGSRRQKAANQLLAVSTLMNHATSDALGGLLLVEAILRYMGWSVQQWNDRHDLNTELDVVAVENSGIHGTDVTSLDDLSRCQEAISSEHGIENCMCGSLTHTQPTEDMHAEPVNCKSRTIDDSEVVPNEPNVEDLTMHSVESHAVGTLHNETEKLCSKEFSAKISERVDSENADIESDETAKENILDSTTEVEESLDNFTRVQSDKIELHSINSGKELVEERKTQLETEHPTGQEPEMRVTNSTCPARMAEENVIHREDPLDKIVIALRGAAADDVTQMFTTEVSDHLEASIKDKELVADNESSPHSIDPSILEDSCLGTKEIRVDGEGSKVDSNNEYVTTVSNSLDPSLENGVTETLVDGAQNLDGSPYINHTAASVTLKDLSDLGDDKKSVETGSINDSAYTCETEPQPAENGDSIVNFSHDADVKSETEADNYDADVNRKLNGVVDRNSSENDGSIVNLSHDGVVKFEAEADNGHADVNKKFDGVLNANCSDMRSDFLICEVNGVKELVNGTQTLSVQSDVSETVESGAVSVELNHKSQVSLVNSIESSAIHAHLENEADNSQVDAGKQLKCVADDPGTERKISLSTVEVSEISVPSCNGEDLHSPSDAAGTPVMKSNISLSTSEATEMRTPGKDSHSPSELVDTPGLECKISISIPEASEVKTPVCYGEDLHSPSQVVDTLGMECKIISTSEASEVRAPICNGEDPHSPSKVGDTPSTESKISLSTSEDSHVAPFCNGEDPHSPSEVAETPKGKSKISPSTSNVSEVCAPLYNGEGPCSPSEVDRIEGTDNGVVDNRYQPLIETKISLLTSEVADAIAPCCNGEDHHSSSEVADIPSLSTSEGSEVSHLHSPSEVDKIKGPDNGAVVVSSQPAMNGVQLGNNHGVNQRIECENGPAHVGTKSNTTIDNVEGLIAPAVEEAGEKLEIEAENGPINANELGTSHGSDDKEPESEMNMMDERVVVHDAPSESVADDAEVGLDGRRKGQLNDFTSGISFGSFTNGDLVGNLSIQVTDGASEGNGCLGEGESKSLEATSVATINSPKDYAASCESVERGPSNNDGEGSNELVCTNGVHAEVSTLSPKVSATDTLDGENMGTEDVKLPFYYLIKIPRHEDLELSNQKKLAEAEVEEKTRKRDAIQSECRKAQERWSELKRSVDAAIQEERDTRDQIRAKRKEIDSAQALVDNARDAMTIEDLDRKIADMEHKIQHETMPLREEKDLIREIKQSKQLREQLCLFSSKKQGVQQALDDKDKNMEHSKVLRKEIDALKERLSQLGQATKAARTKFDEQTKKLNELRNERHSANAIRNQAFSNLVLLRKQWSEKAKYFYQYKENQSTAYQCAATGDNELLQQHCVNQVETMMTLWNTNDDFRRDYVRCNRLRILRNFGTLDGRALGLSEEPAPVRVVDRVKVNASVKEAQVSKDATAYPPLVSKAKETDNRSLEKVVQRKNPDNQSLEKIVDGKNSKNNILKANGSTPVKVDVAKVSSLTVEIVEDQEALKLRREQEEVARKAQELMKEEEAAKLKERLRQEEKEKAQQALERKRRLAEKAQAKAEARAKKEAELKEKEREKRARKKEKKKAGNAEIPISKPEIEAVTRTEVSTDEPTKEPDTQEQRSITPATTKRPARTQYTKQSKIIKSIAPPPPPLRNRGKRRMQQWMWVLVAVAAVIGLFFLGNGNFALIRELFNSFN